MAIPAADTDLLIVIRAIQETITDTKIPGTRGGGCHCRPIQQVKWELSLSKRDRSPPPWLRASARGSLAMGQIREYEGPQSAFGPDAKYNN